MISEKSILEMANGGFLERVNYEIPKILDNILDPNTKATGKRKLTITMELVPNEDRDRVTVNFGVKVDLVPTNAIQTVLYLTSDPDTGEACAMELAPQIPGQVSFAGTEQPEPAKLRIVRNF